MQGVGGELGSVTLGGAEPAELIGDLLRADPRRIEQRRASHQRHDGASCGDRGAAAVGVEAGVGDAALPAALIQCQRDADQISARGPARRSRVRALGSMPAAERVFQMVCQVLRAYAHSSEFRARSRALR